MNIRLIAVSALFLSGCASVEPQQFVGPDGGTAYSMKCSGMGRTLDACYKKAGEICPQGYSIVSASSSGSIIAPVGNMLVAIDRQNLAVECK